MQDLRECGEVDVVTAAQRQMLQTFELRQDGEAVGHQLRAVAATQGGRSQHRRMQKNTTEEDCKCPTADKLNTSTEDENLKTESKLTSGRVSGCRGSSPPGPSRL